MYSFYLGTGNIGNHEWSVYSIRTGELICTLRDIVSLARIVRLNQRHEQLRLVQKEVAQ